MNVDGDNGEESGFMAIVCALRGGDMQELDEGGNGDTDIGDVQRDSIAQSVPR